MPKYGPKPKTVKYAKLPSELLLEDILKELKGLRKDAKDRQKESKDEFDKKLGALEDYKKWVTDLMGQKIIPQTTNLAQTLMPGMNLEEIKKNTAKMIKNMMKPEMVETMPKDFQDSYHAIMQSIMKPNDPAFDDPIEPDPREPLMELKNVSETPYDELIATDVDDYGDDEQRCPHNIPIGEKCEECEENTQAVP